MIKIILWIMIYWFQNHKLEHHFIILLCNIMHRLLYTYIMETLRISMIQLLLEFTETWKLVKLAKGAQRIIRFTPRKKHIVVLICETRFIENFARVFPLHVLYNSCFWALWNLTVTTFSKLLCAVAIDYSDSGEKLYSILSWLCRVPIKLLV